MDYFFIAPLSALRKRTRLTKMAAAYVAYGARVKFFGWERVLGESDELRWSGANVSESIILKGGGYVSKLARAMYPLWMFSVFMRVLTLGRRKIIFCLGWETAFPALLAAKFTNSLIVFDDADRFSLIIKLPNIVRRWVEALERWASREAYMHLIPSFSRYEWRGPNMWPLRNTPLRIDFEQASKISFDLNFKSVFTIYVNGWVGETRGAPIFLRLISLLQEKKSPVRMIVAGRVDSDSGRALIAHPLVEFLGEISQIEALAIYRRSDVVLTFYDPAIKINKKAESNKWGDAIFFDVPFIVNSEVVTAGDFLRAGAAFSVDYADVMALRNMIMLFIEKPQLLREAAVRLSRFKAEYPIFDDQLFNIKNKLEACRENFKND